MSLQTFTEAYIAAMLFSSTDESRPDGGDPLDDNYGPEDLAPEALRQIQDECAEFYTMHSHLFTQEHCSYRGCPVDEYAGHDFWLTRNHHGVGFKDGDWDKLIGDVLAHDAHRAGERHVYVGDDGKLHYS
jgi:hypothetical protein